jgi:hypothetical protein
MELQLGTSATELYVPQGNSDVDSCTAMEFCLAPLGSHGR